jgi:acetolactate synthase-1/2/3 large subunit
MLAPTSRLTVELDRIERIPELLRRAVAIANGGRPGPVHLNVREEVFHGEHDFADAEFYADPGSTLACGRRPRPDAELVDRAAALLREAERPVLLAGGGVHLSRAYAELAQLAELAGLPVVTTISGKGSLAETHPLAAGIIGRYSRFGNDLVKAADVLLVVGCKLGEIATSRWSLLSEGTTIVHVDIDAAEPGRVYRTDVGIWADARLALADLRAALEGDAPRLAERRRTRIEAVEAARAAWRTEADRGFASGEVPITMPRVVAELQLALPPESIVVADGGVAAHWSGLLYDVTAPGRHYIANRGHAAIGYGLPGAIGAKLAAPDLPVVALCGDNGFAMAVAELETAKRERTPLVAMVVNNGTLGYVKALQHGMYEGRYQSVDFLDVDYGAVARAFGCEGRRVEQPDELADALAEALASDVPYVLDVLITTDPAEMLPGVDTRTVRAQV